MENGSNPTITFGVLSPDSSLRLMVVVTTVKLYRVSLALGDPGRGWLHFMFS